jgi:hypothetical protein
MGTSMEARVSSGSRHDAKFTKTNCKIETKIYLNRGKRESNFQSQKERNYTVKLAFASIVFAHVSTWN